jgi:hypothetical protein
MFGSAAIAVPPNQALGRNMQVNAIQAAILR